MATKAAKQHGKWEVTFRNWRALVRRVAKLEQKLTKPGRRVRTP